MNHEGHNHGPKLNEYCEQQQEPCNHAHGEYPSQRPAREGIPFACDEERGLRFPRRDWVPEDVGAMHEPAPYLGDLDWSDLVHPYVD